MLLHATPAQVAAWTGAPEPANVASLIRSASILVTRATLTAVYDVDDQGLATDAKVLEAFADATCAQVNTWLALTIDPAKGAADPGRTVAAKSLGSGSVQYAVYAATAQARADAAVRLCPEAFLLLACAGLTNGGPQVHG